MTEALRVAMATGYRPDRTVKLIAYAAEEVGLRGSNEIAAQHLSSAIDVVGVLQLDMTLFKQELSALLVLGAANMASNSTKSISGSKLYGLAREDRLHVHFFATVPIHDSVKPKQTQVNPRRPKQTLQA